jgi:hypothetical protein
MDKYKFTKNKTGETGEEQSKGLLIILPSTGLFIKISSWQVKQSILHNSVMFHGVLKCANTSSQIWL